MLDHFYQDKAERDRINQQASDLIHRVQTELDKNRNKLSKQEAELLATKNAELFRQKENYWPPTSVWSQTTKTLWF